MTRAEAPARRAASLTGFLLMAVALQISAVEPARAQSALTFGYVAVAAADAARVSETVEQVPLFPTTVDTGGPAAQARLDSGGGSAAVASFPPPGAAVSGVPSLVSLVTCTVQCVEAPPYPLTASTDHPGRPAEEKSAGPVTVSGSSQENASSSYAGYSSGDVAAHETSAEANVSAGKDRVVAEAEATATGFTIGPLTLGAVRSSAQVSRGSSDLKTSSSFTVTGAEVNGTSVGIGPGGLTIAGTTVPLPDGTSLREALVEHGITVTYLAPQRSDDGIMSAGVVVTVAHSVPGAVNASVDFVFGRARAFIAAAPAPAPAPVDAQPQDLQLAVDGNVDAPTQEAPAAVTALPVTPAAPTVASVEVAAPDITQAATPALLRTVSWSSSFYLALVGAAFAIFVSLQLIRLLGMRFP